MFNSGVNSECAVDYNLLFCHACLSSNRKLTMLGEFIDIYRKICDDSRMALTPQTNLCWECLALVKKVRAFKKKVDNAQKILDYCVNKHTPLQDSLSNLTMSHTETTTFVPILSDEIDEYWDKSDIKDDSMEDNQYMDIWRDREGQCLFKIEDVRGQCEIVDVNPMQDLSTGSSCDVSIRPIRLEPGLAEAEAERRQRCFQRSAMLVYKRLCGHKYACHFLRPVSDDLAPEYSRVVRRPMDLSTIKRHIKDGVIRTTAEFQRALLLMFSNAFMYNGSDHVIYHMAHELRQEALAELSLMIAAQTHAEVPAARRSHRQSHR